MLTSQAAVPWLPEHCLTSRHAAKPFESLVNEWAKDWLSGQRWRVLGSWEIAAPRDSDEWAVLRDSSRLRILGKLQVTQTLARAILGATEQSKYTPQDLKLMRRIAGQALDELQVRLERSLTPENNASENLFNPKLARYSLLVGIVGEAQIAIEADKSDLVRLVRELFPTFASPANLARPATTLTDEAITVAALLGKATLSVAEFTRLEPGDILVLDSNVSDEAQLMINGAPSSVPVTIGNAGDKMTFAMQEPK